MKRNASVKPGGVTSVKIGGKISPSAGRSPRTAGSPPRSPMSALKSAGARGGKFQVHVAAVEEEEEQIPEQPALFIPSSSPALLIEKSDFHDFLAEMGNRYSFPERHPKCVVVVSSRWVSDTDNVQVMCHPRPKTVHDFFGFAEGLYEVEYCATCDAEHSARVAEALSEGGIPVEFEGNRGFDVGCWSPMCLLFPAANIPVVQVSLHSGREGLMHLRMGQALGALRDIGYLILCTGGITFNLLELGYGDRQPPPAAVVVDKWVKDVMTYEEKKKWPTADAAWDARSQKLAQVFNPSADVSHAALLSHPVPDAFLPLIVASATGGASTRVHEGWAYCALSMASYLFGDLPPQKGVPGVPAPGSAGAAPEEKAASIVGKNALLTAEERGVIAPFPGSAVAGEEVEEAAEEGLFEEEYNAAEFAHRDNILFGGDDAEEEAAPDTANTGDDRPATGTSDRPRTSGSSRKSTPREASRGMVKMAQAASEGNEEQQLADQIRALDRGMANLQTAAPA